MKQLGKVFKSIHLKCTEKQTNPIQRTCSKKNVRQKFSKPNVNVVDFESTEASITPKQLHLKR